MNGYKKFYGYLTQLWNEADELSWKEKEIITSIFLQETNQFCLTKVQSNLNEQEPVPQPVQQPQVQSHQPFIQPQPALTAINAVEGEDDEPVEEVVDAGEEIRRWKASLNVPKKPTQPFPNEDIKQKLMEQDKQFPELAPKKRFQL